MKFHWIIVLTFHCCLTGIGAQICCDNEGYTCASSTGIGSCPSLSGCEENTTEFKLTAERRNFDPYKGSSVNLSVSLSSTEYGENASVTVLLDGTEMETEFDGSRYAFVVRNVNKTNQGDVYSFYAKYQDHPTLCAVINLTIEYVSTVNIIIEKDTYILTKGEDFMINVRVTLDDDQSYVRVKENSPHTGESGHDLSTSGDNLFPLTLRDVTKATSEGSYVISATEFDTDGNLRKEVNKAFFVYVHSTILEPRLSAYYLNGDSNVEITLDVTTELNTCEFVEVIVTTPDGSIENTEFPEAKDCATDVSFLANNYGIYQFTAFEDSEEFGKTEFSVNVTVYAHLGEGCCPDGFMCIVNDNNSTVCPVEAACVDAVQSEFRLTPDTKDLYVSAGEDVSMSVTLTPEKFAENTTVKVTINGVESGMEAEAVGSVFSFVITNVQKSQEGDVITFTASNSDIADLCANISLTIKHVHTTLLVPSPELYYAAQGDNITIHLNVTTELESCENVAVSVKPPNGVAVDAGFPAGESCVDSFAYVVKNVSDDAIGAYEFTVKELPSEENEAAPTASVELYTLSILSDLRNPSEVFISLKGSNGNITCSAGEVSGIAVSWWKGDAKVSNETGDIYQITSNTQSVLHIGDSADFNTGTNFTCKGGDGEKTIKLAVEGPPEMSIAQTEQNYTCVAKGAPRPSAITWKLGDQDISFDNAIVDYGMESVDTITISSTIKIETLTLCLADLKCESSNSRGQTSAVQKLNNASPGIYRERFLIISDEKKTQNEALKDCQGRLGDLVVVEDEEAMKAVTGYADTSNVEEFFIGAKKNAAGAWLWNDGQSVTYPELASTDDKSCAKYVKQEDKWTAGVADCNEESDFICQKTAPAFPTNLALTVPKCGGNTLGVSWAPAKEADGQEIILMGGNESRTNSSSAEVATFSYDDLVPLTEYTVKVVSITNHCTLNPYIEEKATTGAGPPPNPTAVTVSMDDDDDECIIAWEYDGGSGENITFKIEVTVAVNKLYGSSSKEAMMTSYNQTGDARNLTIPATPNSIYTAKVFAQSCAGQSEGALSEHECITPVAAADLSDAPEWITDKPGIVISVPPANKRRGNLSCQFIVVRYLRSDDGTELEPIDEEKFLKIKQADETINIGDDYFTFATIPLSAATEVKLGDGTTQSSCVPLPSTGSRRKRAVEKNANFTALNRVIPVEARVFYYMITTTPNEDGSVLFIANTNSSEIYTHHAEPSTSPHTAVIVLSVFGSVIILLIIFFFYRRWRRNKRKNTYDEGMYFSRRAPSSKGHDYDVL